MLTHCSRSARAVQNVSMLQKHTQFILACVFVTSFVAALAATLSDGRLIALLVGSPALILSGWAFLGHFITLDDDRPGEWSNPERSHTLWYRSLMELLLKLLVFTTVAVTCFWNW